jgi:hypothetical protein
MDQTRQGQGSTQPNPTSTSNTNNLLDSNGVFPGHIDDGLTNLVFMVIHNITVLVFSNETGHFPITSNRGHAYLVIFYIYDASFIAPVPIKNRKKQELLRAYQITHKNLSSRGFKPHLHKMDNETSKDVKDFIQSQQTTLQYTPPDIHCTNSAKQAICTWKNHFTAVIPSLPKSFPIANWCCLTNQCNYTINMLCPCCQNPLLSAFDFDAMEGPYLFDAASMAPSCTPQTNLLQVMEFSCLQRLVHWSITETLPLHPCHHGRIGGDQITYDGNKSTPTATLVTAKLLINSTISTPKAKFYRMDLSNFYLITPMTEYEYM